MKKLLGSLLLLSSFSTFADNNGTYMSDMMNMDNMMYMDFGLGYGTAGNWGTGSLALNAMTMGFYYKPGLGVELGMDMLPSGNYQNNGAMINTFHLAAKGILPLADAFNLYGKLGLGVNAGQGTATSNSMMMGMNMQNMSMITPVNVGPYYGAGMQFNLSKRFGIYIEDSGVIVVGGGNNGGFGNTNITTLGLEVRM
ncbi:hypothetical protein [Aquella oligotrophica]|uniref:Outer membrane protein beta-barrel domain-containing protein n=1 Tax=Aquella oligotrophica TaxID=2067065 RepID=A0A2I7N5Q3_9NEIS|nr:hypothetical protein [Aquella oligotrophica]AUR51807.1 hypothetical protein CUN60_05690 [Aquella oligotrophica]